MTPRLRDHWLRMDLRSVGLFRATIGCVLLCHLADRWSLRDDLFSPSGVLPASLLAASNEIPNFPTLLTALESQSWGSGLFFVIATVAAAALTVGLFTRGAALLSLLAFSTLAHRNPYVLIAGDYVLGSMLLWLQVLPVGERFSVDAMLRRRRCGGDLVHEQGSPSRPSLAVLGVHLQLGLVYFATAWQKTGPTWWHDGTALAHMLGLHRFSRPGAAVLSSLPDSWLAALTHGVLLFEFLVLPLIVLPFVRPWLRRAALMGLISLHLGIACILDTGSFSITMLACLPLLLSSADWDCVAKLTARHTHAARTVGCVDSSERTGERFSAQLKVRCEDSTHPTATSWRVLRVAAIELVSAWLLVGIVASNYGLNFAIGRRDAPNSWLDLPQRFAAAHQRWDMFAPDAPKFDPQLLARVRLRDGRLLSLQNGDELPTAGSDLAPRLRPFTWRVYIGHAVLQFNPQRKAEAEALRAELSRFLLRELAATSGALRQIHSIELWSRSVPTSHREPDNSPPAPEHVSSLLVTDEDRAEAARL